MIEFVILGFLLLLPLTYLVLTMARLQAGAFSASLAGREARRAFVSASDDGQGHARAQTAARHCDLMLAVGSTLSVFPIAGVVPVAKEAGARVVIVNAEPTPFDDIADAVLHQPIGEILPALCAG